MFDGLRRAIGAISVTEERGVIHVGGVPADVISKDIARVWSTSRVNSNMFTKITRSGFSFYSFYALEVYFILDQLRKHPQATTNQRALKRIQDELMAETWLHTIDDEASLNFNWGALNDLTVTPLPHQAEFLRVYESNVAKYQLRGYMLAAAAGSGKSLNSVMLSKVMDADCTIIICPKRAVHDPWEQTLSSCFKEPEPWWTTLRGGLPPESAKWVVFHYEALDQALSWAVRNKKYKKVNIILDECHNLNDPKSQRTQAFMELAKFPWVQSVLWMSGTPIKALGNEAIPFLATIDLRFNDKVQESFTKIFGKQVSRAVEILANRIGLTSFKVSKAEAVALEVVTTKRKVSFPNSTQFTLLSIRTEIVKFVEERQAYYKANERMYYDRYFRLLDQYERQIRDPREKSEYSKYRGYVDHLNKRFDPRADKDIVVWCNRFEEQYICPALGNADRKEFRHVRSIYKYVALKIRGEALGRILTKRRIECFAAMIPHCGLPALIDSTEKKTLIFTSYVEVVRQLDAYLRKEGYKPLLVYAETNKQLPALLKEFKTNPDANPLVATFDSLSTAVPVIEANRCILMNSPFRDFEYNQATSRINRLGQDSIVRIDEMELETGTEPNISSRSTEIMEWSRASVNAIMGLDGVDESVSVEDYTIEQATPFQLILEDLNEEGALLEAQKPSVALSQKRAEANFFFGGL